MTLVDDGGARAGAIARWAGYGLAAAGTAAGVARILQPETVWSTLTLTLGFAVLALGALAPELFEIRLRRGGHNVNPLLGLPALLAFVMGVALQVEDITLPAAGALVGAGIVLVLTLQGRTRPGLRNPLGMQLILTTAGAMFGYGAVVLADIDYDRSAPQTLQVQVLEKYVTHGRSSTTHHLRVPPFASRKKESSVTVDRRTYAALNAGDLVCVVEHKGALGLPWFTARTCEGIQPPPG